MKLPNFYRYKNQDQDQFQSIRSIDYGEIAREAEKVKEGRKVPCQKDKCALVLIDFQVDFIPYRTDAIKNMCEFIYYNADKISDIFLFMQTNVFCRMQFPSFWMDLNRKKLNPRSTVDLAKLNDRSVIIDPANHDVLPSYKEGALETFVKHVVDKSDGITIQDYHSMAGSVGAALMPVVEESVFYHSCLFGRQPYFEYAGLFPLNEYKSVFSTVVKEGSGQEILFGSKYHFAKAFGKYEEILFAGTSASKVLDSASDIIGHDGGLKNKIKILSNCCVGSIKDSDYQIRNITLDNRINSHEWK